jgi:hypothetical protein
MNDINMRAEHPASCCRSDLKVILYASEFVSRNHIARVAHPGRKLSFLGALDYPWRQ